MSEIDSDGDDDGIETTGYSCMNAGLSGDEDFSIDLFGQKLKLIQVPRNVAIGHGAVVWEASVLFAKYIEFGQDKNLSNAKLLDKTVLELGCGPGLAGISMMMKGSKVVLTDLVDVVDVVARSNVTKIFGALTSQGSGAFSDLHAPGVCALDWTNANGVAEIATAVTTVGGGESESSEVKTSESSSISGSSSGSSAPPPYDYVIACDCVFTESLIPDFVRTIRDACGPRSIVYVAHEIRDEDANNLFLRILREDFTVKSIPTAKQHPDFIHPLVQLVMAKPKRGGRQ